MWPLWINQLIEVIDSSVDYDEMAARNIRKELFEDKSTLCFPFSTSINDDGEVLCANGKAYIVHDGNLEEDEEAEEQFYLTDTTSVGFLVEENQGYLVIKSAKIASVAEGWVEVVENCGILDRPMNDFIDSFVS